MQTNKLLTIPCSIICLVYLSFSSFQTQAQTFDPKKYVDSLRKVLPSLKDTSRIKCLNSLAFRYQLDNPDSSRYFSQIALRESEEINYFKGIGHAHFVLARIETSSAAKEQHYLKAIDAYKKIDDKYGLANMYSEIASVYRYLGKHQSAIEYYKRAISLIHQPPATYVKSIRLQKAKELLETKDISVGEAAFKTGFQNLGHFTNAFTGMFGFRPSAIKRNGRDATKE